MKLLFFDDFRLGVLKGGRVVDVTDALPHVGILEPENHIEIVIRDFATFRPALEEIVAREEGVPLQDVHIRVPLPRPRSIYCAFDNYKDVDAPKRPLDFFLKGAGVIGHNDSVVLDDDPTTQCFQPEPELGVVIGREAKNVSAADAMDYVFGYVNMVDVSARVDLKKLEAMGMWRRGPATMFKGKARDTFAPMGPVIATKDEIPDPHHLNVRLWLNGELRQDYSTSRMMHTIPEQIEWLTRLVTLKPGDVISTGTYHEGLSPINDGDMVEVEAAGCERLAVHVRGFGAPKTENWMPPGPPPKSALSLKLVQGMEGTGGSPIRKMFMASLALKEKFGEENVFDLSIMSPVMEPPREFYDELKRLALEPPSGSHRYMPNAGFPETRSAIAAHLADETGLPFEGRDIIMTSGCAASLNITLKAMLNPGEQVILFVPFWGSYRTYVFGYGGVPKPVVTDENFLPDLRALEGAITPQTKAVIINSPSNPSGAVIPEGRLGQIGALLERKENEYGTTIFLISDEVYCRIMFDGRAYPMAWEHYANTVVVTSHSKDLSLAGERIGYAAISPRCQHRAQLATLMENCQMSCGYVSAPALMQLIVGKLQNVTVDLETYQRQRDFMCDNLLAMGYSLKKPLGGLCIYPKSPIEDDVQFVTELMEEHRVLALGGSAFGTPGYFRISFATSERDLEGSLRGFKAMAEKYIVKA